MNYQRAFPVAYTDEHEFQSGMTLRDYIAAKALQALIASGFVVGDYAKHCKIAYAYADAMLEVREQ